MGKALSGELSCPCDRSCLVMQFVCKPVRELSFSFLDMGMSSWAMGYNDTDG